MKPIKNWENVRPLTDAPKLPAGVYVCRLLGAKVKQYQSRNGDTYEKLEIALDITEGEYKNFYQQDFNAQSGEDKRWKGVMRLSIPTGDGSDGDTWASRIFRTCTDAVEDSNPGFHWDWDEAKLKGKTVGCTFQNVEWEYEGKTGWKAMPYRFVPVDDVRSGKAKLPKDKPLESKQSADPSPKAKLDVAVDDEEVPF